jgi:hypothetical protein
MEQLLEYRERLLARYEDAAGEFRDAVIKAFNSTRLHKTGGWSIHQIAVHTRDVEKLVYGSRIRRTLEEENPLFGNFDGEAWMAEHYQADEPIETILDELVQSVQGAVTQLKRIAPEAWTRPSRHATYGDGFTSQTWVERALAHIEEHLKSVTI